MLLGNNLTLVNVNPNLPFLSCHLSYSKRFQKLTIYIVTCLLDREYSIYFQENIVCSIYVTVYIYSNLREYLYF